jgi:hypothetical protein
MDLPLVIGIAGCMALLAGLFGGGLRVRDIEIPTISKTSRGFSSIVGVGLIVAGIWLSRPDFSSAPLADTTMEPSSVGFVTTPDISAATRFRIVEAHLRADPFDYVGSCPVMITFSGRISVAGGAGTVSYKWIRNDGASAPVETLSFAAPSSQDVNTTWYLGDSGMNYSGWMALQILDPEEVITDRAEFTIQCE